LVYADGNKNLTCAVNGEIYNWKDLISGLKNRDVPLVTGSDCEVIMHLVSIPPTRTSYIASEPAC